MRLSSPEKVLHRSDDFDVFFFEKEAVYHLDTSIHMPREAFTHFSGVLNSRRAAIAAAVECQAESYLEFGVRRGHSLAAVMMAAKGTLKRVYAIDCWTPNYSGESNPGPNIVDEQLERLGLDTKIVQYDSRRSKSIAELPDTYDVVLIDGSKGRSSFSHDLELAMSVVNFAGMIIIADFNEKNQDIEEVSKKMLLASDKFDFQWSFDSNGVVCAQRIS